ncbi:MAG: hypothetical protein GWO20_16575 [Candidatus Korarchaeota archaeon]|nr:hypothetical protein [Candidatus Korarchaeota archaeon]NIU85020.1 hypothetical protein [Candidatus Thorarchaeota archaeon]NIW15045.1 hypothetical protein [Candidatus Thorarchaeota archaeon]NIW53055.1 hypothetical protein [Candidatus Korarchaeota archaeon]
MKVKFRQGKGTCSGEGEEWGAIEEAGGTITFEGAVITPNPCYRLSLRQTVSHDHIELRVLKHSTKQICIQCIARIPFEGKVYDVSGEKTISLLIGEKEVSRKDLKIVKEEGETEVS